MSFIGSENISPYSYSSKGRAATDSGKQGKWSEKLRCREKIRGKMMKIREKSRNLKKYIDIA